VLVVVLVIAAVAYWWYGRSFEDTDDAQVDGHIYPVSARINGHITKVNVEDGQFVKAGTVSPKLTTPTTRWPSSAPRRLHGRHRLAEAAGFSVPISQVGSSSQIHSAQSDVISADAGISAANKQVERGRGTPGAGKANAATANATWRATPTVSKKEISQQQYDQANAAAISANAQVTAVEAALRSAQEMVKQPRRG